MTEDNMPQRQSYYRVLPDCNNCAKFTVCGNPFAVITCTNGSEFKQSQPIRLYTVEVDDGNK